MCRVVFINLMLVYLSTLAWADAGVNHLPVFRSVPTTVKTSQSDTVLLPCYVDNLGHSIVRWWWQNKLIADSSEPHMLTPLRFKMHSNHTLQVSNLRREDTGEYKCEVVRPAPWGSIYQVHAIEVLYPPSVERIPSSGRLEVQLGQEVDMTCKAQGVPTPILTWFSKGKEMQLIDNRPRLRFIAEDRRQSGVYQCVATNGVGSPATTSVSLRILHPPEVSTDKHWIHTGIGVRSELSCHVVADPVAEVEWIFGEKPVSYSSRVIPIEENGRAKLLFRHVERGDLGFYTCRASNHLGFGQSIIELSGVANVANFKTDVHFYSESNYTLIWEVDSYSAIIEYELLFRKYVPPSQDVLATGLPWNTVVVPADSHVPGPLHSKAFTLTGLKKATQYEVMLQSRNLFGWSQPSSILRFSTLGIQVDENELALNNSEQNNVISDATGLAFISEENNFISGKSTKGASISLFLSIFILVLQLVLKLFY